LPLRPCNWIFVGRLPPLNRGWCGEAVTEGFCRPQGGTGNPSPTTQREGIINPVRSFENCEPGLLYIMELSLDAAAGVAAGQGQDLVYGDLVVIALDGLLQAAGCHRKLDGLLGIKAL